MNCVFGYICFKELLIDCDDVFPIWLRITHEAFPGGSVVKNPPANAENTGLIPGLGRCSMPGSN